MIKVGDVIDDRYRIVELIGSGGTANIFEAFDIVSKRIVAIKIIKEELLSDDDLLKSFIEETNIIASMSHPNIVQVFNNGYYKNCPYIVLEYLKEQILSTKLDYWTKLPLNEVLDIMEQLLDAVEYTHKHGLIHRDIKPQNIFYLSNGTIKLGDFGIATLISNSNNKIMGSINYLAPEVLSGYPFSTRSDIYACGITLYQLLTGHLPFEGTPKEVMKMQIEKKIPLVSEQISEIPKEIDEIIKKATSKQSSNRYLNAEQFKKDILDFKKGTFKKENLFSKILRKL